MTKIHATITIEESIIKDIQNKGWALSTIVNKLLNEYIEKEKQDTIKLEAMTTNYKKALGAFDWWDNIELRSYNAMKASWKEGSHLYYRILKETQNQNQDFDYESLLAYLANKYEPAIEIQKG
jgi:hypothetical protein